MKKEDDKVERVYEIPQAKVVYFETEDIMDASYSTSDDNFEE